MFSKPEYGWVWISVGDCRIEGSYLTDIPMDFLNALINSLELIKLRVPDVSVRTPYASEIYSLYAKGILNGVDGSLTFKPNDTLTRAEMAAIVSRMARAEQRLTL